MLAIYILIISPNDRIKNHFEFRIMACVGRILRFRTKLKRVFQFSVDFRLRAFIAKTPQRMYAPKSLVGTASIYSGLNSHYTN
jgi:hypothetical protein